MWKKHPIIHFAASLAITLGLGLLLGLSIPLGSDFWADRQSQPVTIEGVIFYKMHAQFRNTLAGFDVRSDNGQTYHFEVAPRLLAEFSLGEKVKVNHSPHSLHVYDVRTEDSGFIQDGFDANAAFQQWQTPLIWLLILAAVVAVAALIYGLLCLFDWLQPVRVVRGVLIARVEQADNSAAGYALVLRTGSKAKSQRRRETSRFQVSQNSFLKTDQVDYLELEYTPIFKYVRRLRILTAADFPPDAVPSLAEGGPNNLRYHPGWQFKTFLFADFSCAVLLYALSGFILLTRLPIWFGSGLDARLYERYILPALAFGALIIALFLSNSFLRKLRDLRSPKKLTIGPVLSKWRVTGVNNDARRQIVVADGGLQAGSAGVRKFDINDFLYDEIKVGDIVEIEHSPRLRYIFRLEVTGHQEVFTK